jgi:putative endonuclease
VVSDSLLFRAHSLSKEHILPSHSLHSIPQSGTFGTDNAHACLWRISFPVFVRGISGSNGISELSKGYRIRQMNHRKRGSCAEERAARYLVEDLGYDIIARNFRHGRKEIDIIAKDDDRIVFVEVKMRNSNEFGYPEESVDRKKRVNIASVARYFITTRYRGSIPESRFDVITFFRTGGGTKMTHLKNAFDDPFTSR